MPYLRPPRRDELRLERDRARLPAVVFARPFLAVRPAADFLVLPAFRGTDLPARPAPRVPREAVVFRPAPFRAEVFFDPAVFRKARPSVVPPVRFEALFREEERPDFVVSALGFLADDFPPLPPPVCAEVLPAAAVLRAAVVAVLPVGLVSDARVEVEAARLPA